MNKKHGKIENKVRKQANLTGLFSFYDYETGKWTDFKSFNELKSSKMERKHG